MHCVRYVCCVLLFGILFAGCSGGIEQDTRTEAVVTLVMTDPETGAETDTVSKADPARLTATVTDLEGNPIVNGTVRFSTQPTGVIEPESATAVTDENGQARVRLSAGSVEGVGT
ncbi:MAG: Ig-like domain-containing protein, partial [Thermodesulfobacteriota bacterium]